VESAGKSYPSYSTLIHTYLNSHLTPKPNPTSQTNSPPSSSYAEQISTPSTSLHPIPAHWTFASAAGLAATAPVSYGALKRANLLRGETILIHAAAGGLGLMAVQMAKAIGARVIATASTAEKLEVARRFGADECVNYSEDKEWWKIVLRLTNGEGVDVVYDSVGLVGDSIRCLRWKGRVLVVGFAGREGDLENLAVNRVLLKQAQVIGYVSLFLEFGDDS
jgi:NADPH2:quinone reductase